MPAPPEVLLDVLSRPGRYAAWWPGATSKGPRLGLANERAGTAAVVRTERDAVEVRLPGPVSLIWVVQRFQGGTIVHGIIEPAPAGRRLLRARARLRDALVALWRQHR